MNTELSEKNLRFFLLTIPRTRGEIVSFFKRPRSTVYDYLRRLEINGKVEKEKHHGHPLGRRLVYWRWIGD